MHPPSTMQQIIWIRFVVRSGRFRVFW